jgi:Mg-chelatase subunit ChlD
MTLLHPVWLLLAVPLGVSLLLWQLPSRFLQGLRAVILLLVLFALAGLALRLPSRAGTVIVVADRSLSMPADADERQKQDIGLIQDARGSDEHLAIVSFGQRSAVERLAPSAKFAGFAHEVGGDASNLAEAIDTALALVPRDAPGKILLLTDGRWTGRDPTLAGARAAARGITLDYRMLQRTAASDVAVARVEAPASVGPGESFLITAWVNAPAAQEVTFELRRGDKLLASGKRQVSAGLNRLTFRDRAGPPGTLAYTLRVSAGQSDPVPENNRARLLVGVRGPRPLLLVTAEPDKSGLARLLKAGGLNVKAVRPQDCAWTLEDLSRVAAVLLDNVPAEQLGTAGMETLAAWVRETGAGLMMTGGRGSYGPGGYFRSPLEPIMPVSMELRKEHRKLSLAIVVAMDRSGSMAMPIGGGRVKMDLANLGAVQVLDLLAPGDEFGVIAIDTLPHVIQPIGPVAAKGPIRDRILRIRSEGGGIFIFVALEAAAEMLLKAKAGTKHIILFADAADSEEPGRYAELIAKCRTAGITVSVIGLGRETDKDGALLKDIAKRGGGRCFFSNDPRELPRLFAQDTFVVARSSFLDELTPFRTTAGLNALAGKAFANPPRLGGYNLCYLRPGANLAAVTTDEYTAPVVAAWQAGAGRVLCYTGEADGKYTGPIAKWGQVGELFTSLARWTLGPTGELPGNMLVTQRVNRGVAEVRLHLDPARKGEPFAELPKVNVLRGQGETKPQAEKDRLHWLDADTLGLDVPLHGEETVLATVEVPGHGPGTLPPTCLPYSPEFRPGEGGAGLATMERLARATGGQERVELAGLWQEMPKVPRLVEMGPWLLLAAVLLLLVEIFERRTGLVTRGGRIAWDRVQAASSPLRRKKKAAAKPLPQPAGATRKPISASPTPEPVVEAPESPPSAEPSPEPQPTGAGLLEALRKVQARRPGRKE